MGDNDTGSNSGGATPMSPRKVSVSQFQRDVAQFLKLVAKTGGGQLTCNQMVILAEVWISFATGQPVYVSDIQRLCNMPKATASRTVASLGDTSEGGMGFLSTQTDPSDRRKKLLVPSKKLIQINQQMSKEFKDYWLSTR